VWENLILKINVCHFQGITQISLAEFNTDEPSRKWYNILSTANLDAPLASCSSTSNANAAEVMACNFKEESSDESTIISSQTSTLTRNQGQEDMQAVLAMNLDHLNIVASDEEDDDDDDIEEEDQQHAHLHGLEADAMCGGIDLDDLDDDIEHHHETTEQMIAAYMNEMKAEMADKETNTECAFLPERARNRLRNPAIEASKEADDRLVKRSQTFSPSAVGNKTRYICRLNRSDSDSAMHFHTITPHPFRRNAVERRSLRYHNRVPRTAASECFYNVHA
jgi:protein KIBRA